PAPMNRIDLHNGWTVQTSRNVQATGDTISTPMFQTTDWYRTSVPMTVLAVQVAAGEFPEPYYGMNLRKIPGIDAYKIGETFADKPIPDDSPYAASWWYRTRSEEHTSELQSLTNLVCRLLLEKKNTKTIVALQL